MSKKIIWVFGILLCLGFFVCAQQTSQSLDNSGSSSISMPNQQNQGLTSIQKSITNFGIPQQSFASPEYVAQEKMIESMTTAYNWISLNTSRFAQGCKEDRSSLISEISVVLSKAQETSTVCNTFESESKACNPEKFCARFKQGNIPLSSNSKAILEKLGYDSESLKIEDLTADLISKVCVERRKIDNEEQTLMLESVKQKIQSQLPDFRKKCELLKQARGHVPEVMLPNIDIRPQMQQNYQQSFNQQPMQNIQGGCKEPHPDCYPLPAPICRNGAWVCEGIVQQQIQNQMPQQTQPLQQAMVCQDSMPNCASGISPMCQNGVWVCPSQTIEQSPMQPQPTINQQSLPLEQPAQTPVTEPMPENSSPATGAVTLPEMPNNAVCGNTICEPDFGENNLNCPQDCMPEAEMPNYNQPMQQYNQQSQTIKEKNIMPSPEQLCKMSNEEIIEIYTMQMSNRIPSIEEIQYQCSEEAQRELNNLNRYKFEVAKCKADAALDCEAKKQALKNCNELKTNPEKVAGIIVNSMCRRFGITATDSESKLYEIANKWVNSDPALANQLGDTADQISQAKAKLDVLSYVFGNLDYANSLDSKASELRAIRQKLASSGVNDFETLNALDSQAKAFELESQKFKKFFDLGRISELFK